MSKQKTGTDEPTNTPVEGDEPTPALETPEPTSEEKALAALDEGIETVTPKPKEAEASTEDDPDAGKAKPVAEGEKNKPVEGKATDDKGKKKDDTKPEPDPEIEKEITERGLKDKAADRFRELANTSKEYAPYKEQLTKLGITSAEQLPVLAQKATDLDDMVQMVSATGSNADQFGATLDYLTLVNRAKSGDAKSAEQAFTMISTEYHELARLLGKDVGTGNGKDALDEHPDLKQEVEDGGISRARALEIVAQREREKLNTAARTRHETEHTQAQAVEQGRTALTELGHTLEAADPDYRAKLPYLLPSLETIKRSLPPDQWAEATQKAYSMIPKPAPAAAGDPPHKKPSPGPMSTGVRTPAGGNAGVRAVPKSIEEALDMGIEAASQ